MNKRIYLSSPTMHGLEMKYIQEAFDANWVAPLGKNVDDSDKPEAEFYKLYSIRSYVDFGCLGSWQKSRKLWPGEHLPKARKSGQKLFSLL